MRMIAICAVLTTSACSSMLQNAGDEFGKGLVKATQTEIKGGTDTAPGPFAERTARDVTRGALAEVTQAEHLAELQLVANTAAVAALRGMATATGREHQSAIALVTDQAITGVTRALARELDTGPLANSMDATTAQVSGAMVRGIADEMRDLMPECGGEGRQKCLENQVMQLSRAAALGMRDGLGAIIALPLLGFSFIGGALLATFITWLLMHRHQRRMAE